MKTLLLLISIAGILAWTGCADDPVTLHGNLYESTDEVFASFAPPVQTFILNASTGGTITGMKGTTVEFPSNAFMDNSGNSISGDVTITLIEVLNKADMIGSGIYSTNSDGGLLSSGGEIYLSVSQGGTRLEMAYGAYYELNVPAFGATENMGFYEGTGISTDSFWNYVSPTLDSLPFGLSGYRDTSIIDLALDTYEVISNVLGWVNCDAYPEIPFIDCNIHFTGLEDLPPPGVTNVFFLGDSEMLAAYPAGFEYDVAMNMAYNCHVPSTSGYLLVTTIKTGNLYFGITPNITPVEGATFEITMTAGTPEDLEALLLTL